MKLKQTEGKAEQKQVDDIVAMSDKQSEAIFREMLKPILKIVDESENMEELMEVLKDEARLEKLYREMESPELEELIRQGIYLSHLVGRTMG